MSNNQLNKDELTAFGIETEFTDYNSSKYHIICVPYSKTVTYIKGAENGPKAIIEASTQVELYDAKSNSEPYLKGISLKTIDVNTEITSILKNIKNETLNSIKNNKFPVMLGGEHSISQGCIEACKEYSSDLSVLHIDAHADLREEYLGDPFNHACAMRYCVDNDINLVQVGIRSLCKEEHETIKENSHKIKTFFANGETLNIEEILKSIKNKHVYITIDLDGLDPSVIPHTGTPEPGGLSWYDLINLLEGTFKKFNVLASDIVELAPNENSIVSDFAAAKLLHKILSLKD